ncbi:MAG: PGPGW domain-containing protein [Planctomycetota bacterium]
MGPFLEWIRATNGRTARRLLVGAVGGTMALAGIALLVLPGPGIPLLLAGLGVLGLEFAIARTWMEALKRRAEGAGVPRQALWALPAAGIALSIAVTVATGLLSVVHGHGTWRIVRKPSLSWRLTYASVDELSAADAGPDAAELLRRSGLGPPR